MSPPVRRRTLLRTGTVAAASAIAGCGDAGTTTASATDAATSAATTETASESATETTSAETAATQG